MDVSKIKKFSDLGIDNGAIFDVPKVSINDILNIPIIVESFVLDVKTKYEKASVLVKYSTTNGEEGKFFTQSSYIEKILKQIDAERDLPFLTTIKRTSCKDGHSIYSFN